MRKKPKAFQILKGKYYNKPEENDELQPLGEIALPKSIIQEDEEKDLRKLFNKNADDDVVDLYERHAAVTVKPNADEEEAAKNKSKAGLLLVLFILILGLLLGGVFVFREPLKPHLQKLGINLPD